MPDIFYQANFCAECGNSLEPRQSWRPRYLCDDCAARIRQRGYITPLSLAIGLLAIWFGLSDRQHSISTSNALNQPGLINSPPSVSALDASPKQKPLTKPETQERVICGARTKKGTPCRHSVRRGQRCAQHRGMASLLEKKSTH